MFKWDLYLLIAFVAFSTCQDWEAKDKNHDFFWKIFLSEKVVNCDTLEEAETWNSENIWVSTSRKIETAFLGLRVSLNEVSQQKQLLSFFC